jgi:hypothetical protein
MTTQPCNDCGEVHEQTSDEEVRRQIKGNLMLACDTWDMENLLNLERMANEMVLSGIATQGLLYKGLIQTTDLIFDKQGKLKLSSNPDDENSAFRVLAEMLKEQDQVADLPFDEEEPLALNEKPDYSTFF